MPGTFKTLLRALTIAGFAALPAANALAGYAHFVMDANTGKVLAASNADTRNYPASLTKMMTLYMTFEAMRSGRIGWNSKITMNKRGAAAVPLKLGIRAGHSFTVREAVNAMIVRSANDVAEAMCDYLAGKKSNCGAYLTNGARRLGMKSTAFRNGSGLPDSRQVSTARDMAKLGLALMRDFPNEYKLFSQTSFVFRGRRINGHNHLMARYKGMNGIKTGFTNASGFNIVTAVERDGKRLIGVVMGGKSARRRDNQMAKLLDAAMRRASSGRLMVSTRIPIPVARPYIVASVAPARQAPPAPLSRPADTVSEAIAAYAAPVPPSPITRVAATVNTGAGSRWEIQIAAVDSERAAVRMLNAARGVASGLGSATAYTQPVQAGGSTLYRARFSGFRNQEQAQSTCRQLKANAYQCLVIANSGNS